MPIHDLVADAATRAPDSLAVTDGTAALTFAELHRSAAALGATLRDAAGTAGARVAIVADNCAAYVQVSYAASAGGLVLAPLNQRTTVDEQVALVEAAGSAVLAGQPTYLEPLRAPLAEGRMPTIRAIVALPVEGALPDDASPDPRHPFIADPDTPDADLAWLLATSGTTGRAKLVQLTHSGLAAAARATLPERPLGEGDVFSTCFSLCHVAAYNVLITHLAGCPLVLRPRFRADDALDAIERHGVTMASLAPTMIVSLLDHLDEHPEARSSLRTLRAIAYGSSAIGPTLLRRTLEQLGVDLYQGYGMTEAAGNVAFLGPDDHRRAVTDTPGLLTACGRPSAAVDVRILGSGTGEIAIRGAQVTTGYWRDDEASRAAFVDGWYRTGDVGRFDEEGYLHIVDRVKDIVVSGGENISSRQVEEALLQLDGIEAVAVTGVPDERWGEAVCACVETPDGRTVDLDAVRERVRPLLPAFAVPKHVLAIGELPRTSTGKVRKDVLRTWAVAELARPAAGTPR